MPTITIASDKEISGHIARLEKLLPTILGWESNPREAQKAKASFDVIRQALSNFIGERLDKKDNKGRSIITDAKRGELIRYREQISAIGERVKGLDSKITAKIAANESAARETAARDEERSTRNEKANAAIGRLLPELESIVAEYERSSDDALHGRFKDTRTLLNEQIALLTDDKQRAAFQTQLLGLNTRVNRHTERLEEQRRALEAERQRELEAELHRIAEEQTEEVSTFSLRELIYDIADDLTRQALSAIASVLRSGMEFGLSLLTDVSRQLSLVVHTGDSSQMSSALALISGLPAEDQVAVINDLISGRNDSAALASLDPTSRLALTAVMMNQLAQRPELSLSTGAKTALQNFSTQLVTTLQALEQGATAEEDAFLSVFVRGEAAAVTAVHLRISELRANPIAGIEQLLRGGIGRGDAQIVTALTTARQVDSLTALQDGTMTRGSLVAALGDTPVVRQLTDGLSSTGALTIHNSFALAGASTERRTPTVDTDTLSVLQTLAAYRRTVEAAAMDRRVAELLRDTALVERAAISDNVAVVSAATHLLADEMGTDGDMALEQLAMLMDLDMNEAAEEAAEAQRAADAAKEAADAAKKAAEAQRAADAAKEAAEAQRAADAAKEAAEAQRAADAAKEADEARARALLLSDFDKAFEILSDFEPKLAVKYPNEEAAIRSTCQRLMENLSAAKNSYEQGRCTRDEFKRKCFDAINDAKKTFNTHRSNIVVKVLGDALQAFGKFITNLFSSGPQKQSDQDSRARFFGHSERRVTKSGEALYQFNTALESVFEDNEPKSRTAPGRG